MRGIHSCHFSKETLIIPIEQLVLVFNPLPFYFDTEIDVVCAPAHSLAHSINHLIHNLHIYLRVNICKKERGHFCEFCCNIASLHRNMGQPPLPPPGVPGCFVLTAGQCPTTLETQEGLCLSAKLQPLMSP